MSDKTEHIIRQEHFVSGVQTGIDSERERIIAIVKRREEEMPHKDYSPQDVIDLVNGKLE